MTNHKVITLTLMTVAHPKMLRSQSTVISGTQNT